jgi:hypothetical protein
VKVPLIESITPSSSKSWWDWWHLSKLADIFVIEIWSQFFRFSRSEIDGKVEQN